MSRWLLLGFLCLASAAHSQSYTIQALYAAPGDFQANGWDINSSGVVAGDSVLNANPHGGFWNSTAFTPITPSANPEMALGINDAGDVTGFTYDRTAFFYKASTGVTTTVSATGPYPWAYGQAINNSGIGVGYFSGTSIGVTTVAVMYTASGPTILGTLGGQQSYGIDINDSSQVTGWSSTTNGTTRAYRAQNGVMTQLNPSAGFFASVGNSINSSGVVAGSSFSGNDGAATIWTGTSASSFAQPIGATSSQGRGINDSGLVVGLSTVSGVSRASVFSSSGSYLLQNHLVDPTGWTLYRADAVNSLGWITGTGLLNGVNVAYIAKPVPEPMSILALSLGLVIIKRRRKG